MIKSLDELTAFLKICRKQGVTEIKFEGVSVTFGELPKKPRREDETDDTEVQMDGPTDEQLAMWSVGVTEQ